MKSQTTRPRWAFDNRSERVLAMYYPFGVTQPKSGTVVRAQPHSGKVLFIAGIPDDAKGISRDGFSGPQGQLLLKAVVQGLKWQQDQIDLIFAFPDRSSEPSLSDAEIFLSARTELEREIKKIKPKIVVALGTLVEQVLEIMVVVDAPAVAGCWLERQGTWFLSTADLRAVAKDGEIKRRFWNDLKALAHKLKQINQCN